MLKYVACITIKTVSTSRNSQQNSHMSSTSRDTCKKRIPLPNLKMGRKKNYTTGLGCIYIIML